MPVPELLRRDVDDDYVVGVDADGLEGHYYGLHRSLAAWAGLLENGQVAASDVQLVGPVDEVVGVLLGLLDVYGEEVVAEAL